MKLHLNSLKLTIIKDCKNNSKGIKIFIVIIDYVGVPTINCKNPYKYINQNVRY